MEVKKMEIGEIAKVREDVQSLFFLTQNKVLSKEECRELLNDVRTKLGFSKVTPEDFDKNFSAPPQIPQPSPAPVPIVPTPLKEEVKDLRKKK
jgi:hypothetical protein